MKRIVICCDGTWSTPDEMAAGIPWPTNVLKMAEAVRAAGVPQSLYYDCATGTGPSANLREAYRHLVSCYEVGDEIFLFGFSRGAFTVRSLTGLIRNCGVLSRADDASIDRAFTLYRSRSHSTHPREREATRFRRTYAVADVTPIQFIGVWDTVGALGNPRLLKGLLSRRNEFHDTALGTSVERAYQALAIDEKRLQFSATLWQQQQDAVGQVLEQVWFAGAHSDVGGGQAECGLSDISLGWMAEKAAAAGLALAPLRVEPDPQAPIHESRTGAYRVLPAYSRPIGAPKALPTCESLHPSVLERHLKLDYRPDNLVDYFLRNPAQRP